VIILPPLVGSRPPGRLFLQTQERAYHSEDVVGFLRVLLRKICGKLLVVCDGAPIHRGQSIKDFLRRGAAKRLHLEQLPGYSPDLNPAEGIWNYLKRVELANRCCADLATLGLALRRAKERLRHKPNVLHACLSTKRAAPAREVTSTLLKMDRRCASTVRVHTANSWAMCGLERPTATGRSTFTSRA
jgi:transposase